MTVRYWLPICLFTLMVVWPLAGAAHTHLDKSEPAADAVLATAPQTVRLIFSSRIEPGFSQVEVTDAEGREIAHGEPTESGNRREVEVALDEELATGTYQVNWSVVARDGHRMRGEYRFSVE